MRFFENFKKGLIIFTFVIFTCLILMINLKTPLIGEDYVLAIPLRYQEVTVFERIPQVMGKIGLQIKYWNARIGEQLAIIYLSFDKNIFNILNTIVFLGFCYLAIVFAQGKFPKLNQLSTYFLIMLGISFLVVFVPTFGEIFFWVDGATNYLWSITILLLFLLPYHLLFRNRDVLQNKPVITTLFYILAIFAGFTNENTVPVILMINLAQLVWLIKWRKNVIRIPKWHWIGSIILSISFLCFILIPSTRHRINYYNSIYNVTDPDLMYYLNRAKIIFLGYIKAAYPLIVFVVSITIVFIVIALIKKWVLSDESKKKMKVIGLMMGMSIISQVILAFVPYYEIRTGLITWFFWMVLLIFIVDEFHKHISLISYLLALFIVFGLYQTSKIIPIYDKFYDEVMARHYLLIEKNSEGITSAVVKPYITQSSRVLNTREEYLLFENQLYANYYGLQSIEIINSNSNLSQ